MVAEGVDETFPIHSPRVKRPKTVGARAACASSLAIATCIVALAACARDAGPSAQRASATNGSSERDSQAIYRTEDPAALRIELRRQATSSHAPAYTLIGAGDGRVTFRGVSNVRALGTRTATIPELEVESLIAELALAGFSKLGGAHANSAGDRSPTELIVHVGEREFSARDCDRDSIDAAHAAVHARIRALAHTIDERTGSARWIQDYVDTQDGY